jgi:hypothetical protein
MHKVFPNLEYVLVFQDPSCMEKMLPQAKLSSVLQTSFFLLENVSLARKINMAMR